MPVKRSQYRFPGWTVVVFFLLEIINAAQNMEDGDVSRLCLGGQARPSVSIVMNTFDNRSVMKAVNYIDNFF